LLSPLKGQDAWKLIFKELQMTILSLVKFSDNHGGIATMESSSDDSVEDDPKELERISDATMIKGIEEYLLTIKGIGMEENGKLLAILEYLRHRRTGKTKKNASEIVRISHGKSSYWAQCLVAWTKEWHLNRKITLSNRGIHPKVKNLLADSDIFIKLRSWIVANHKFDITPQMLRAYVNREFFPLLGVTY
jgi:hypothetical protein